MTEKRFKLIEDYDWWGVTDNQLPKTKYGFCEDLPNGYLSCDYKYNDLTPQEVVDLLNAFYKENKELKGYLQHFGFKMVYDDNGHTSLEQIKIKKMKIRNGLLDGWIK